MARKIVSEMTYNVFSGSSHTDVSSVSCELLSSVHSFMADMPYYLHTLVAEIIV